MLLLCGGGFWGLLDAVFAVEALYAARRIDQPLLAGVKGMTIRAHLDMHLIDGRARLEGVAACASHYAAMVFGMDCSFHLSPYIRRSGYHPKDKHTILPVNDLWPRVIAIFLGIFALGQTPSQVLTGFAAPQRTDFAPILRLAAPGPHRAERAMAALDRQLIFERQVLNPQYSPELDRLLDLIPPRNSTLIRAASEYSRTDIPWMTIDGMHELCAQGFPNRASFYVTTSSCETSAKPFHLDAYFALKPTVAGAQSSSSTPAVIGSFGGQIKTDTFGFGAIVDAVASALTEVYGDLAPPWDAAPGAYNHHDDTARARFRRDLPALDDKFHEYFKCENVLDEFSDPGGPIVLFNFIGEVRAEALKKFPDLYRFYTDLGPAVTTQFDVMDDKGHYWMRSGFDHGKVRLTFMVRDGKLSTFDAAYHPVGEPLALDALRHGVNHTRTTAQLRRMGMTFGLADVDFTNYFTRDASTVSFQARMETVPEVIAPPGIQQGAEFIAGEFMRTVAQGSGGMHGEVASHALDAHTIRFSSDLTAEFMYSPTLEFFAKIGDAIADKHNFQVREQERKFMEEFLDAFVKDYNNARSGILALDRDTALTK
jgi:hypothetical protein